MDIAMKNQAPYVGAWLPLSALWRRGFMPGQPLLRTSVPHADVALDGQTPWRVSGGGSEDSVELRGETLHIYVDFLVGDTGVDLCRAHIRMPKHL